MFISVCSGSESHCLNQQGSSPAVRSVLLLSEQNARHVCGVLRYLKRTDTTLPPELLEFALGVQQAKEQLKADRALCSYLKSLGYCRYYHPVQFVCMCTWISTVSCWNISRLRQTVFACRMRELSALSFRNRLSNHL